MSRDGAAREKTVLFLVAAVQFVNICDFMIVSPLGPQLARSIGMLESDLADATAAYMFAAGVSGAFGSFLLDRFDRRSALAVSMLGLVLGTALGGLATSLGSLVAARILAGAFGGPATSLSLAIMADVVPEERRGRAIGLVTGAFGAAFVVGVPMGLALAELGSWRIPLFALAGVGLALVAVVLLYLPPLRAHLTRTKRLHADQHSILPVDLLRRGVVWASYLMTATASGGSFMLFPNISTYVQNNLGLPIAQLKYMYLAGGVVNFFTTRITGRFVDRFGTVIAGGVGTLLQMTVIYFGYAATHLLPIEKYFLPCVFAVYMSLMFANGIRIVSYNTLTSRVPRPHERARFMSLQSSVWHLSAAVGAYLSARILATSDSHQLLHFEVVSYVAIVTTATLPFLMALVERRLRQTPAAPLSPNTP